MNRMRILACTLALGTSLPVLALQADQHQSHHPDEPAAAPAPASEASGMDAQIEAMHAMHEKMMAAKTTDERKALMAEHARMMRDGMKAMDDMSRQGGGCAMVDRDRHMAKRMEMMQAMMQMMMDHVSHETNERK
jgi:hypothetical protein